MVEAGNLDSISAWKWHMPLLFISPRAKTAMGLNPSGCDSIILPQDGAWVGRNSKCFDGNVTYGKGNGKRLEKCFLPFSNEREEGVLL